MKSLCIYMKGEEEEEEEGPRWSSVHSVSKKNPASAGSLSSPLRPRVSMPCV